LRFKEFSDEWEVKKVEDIFSLFNGYAFSSYQSTKNGSLWVKIADVGIGKMKKDNLSYLPTGFIEKHKKFLLKEGDYVVALTRPILKGELKIAKIDKHFNNSLLNQRVGKLETKNNYDFVYFLLQKNKLISLIQDRIAGSDPPNLSPKEINSIKQLIPSLQEQQKIANFLTSVDKKTTQLQEKKTLLEQYKKGVMQQLFPSTGSGQVPELRFKPAPSEVEEDAAGNEYADWEEKKLGEVAVFSKGKGISKKDISANGKIQCIRYGELYTHYGEIISKVVSKTDISIQDLVLSEENDVIIPSSGETQIDIATASCVLNRGIALGGDLNIIRSDFNGVFLSYYLNSVKKYDIARLSQGISVVHLYSSQLSKLNIEIPLKVEQTQIANFLSAIATKIELVSTQLENTQQFKKGLLQQLFV